MHELPSIEGVKGLVPTSLARHEAPIERRIDRLARLVHFALDMPIVTVVMGTGDDVWFESMRAPEWFWERINTASRLIVPHHETSLIIDNLRDPIRTGTLAAPIAQALHESIQFFANFPLRSVDRQQLGVLCVMDTKPRALDDESRQVLKDLAAMFEGDLKAMFHDAVQLELIDQLNGVQNDAQVDPLTGLWNRAGFDERFHNTLQQCAVEQAPIGAMMVDVDHFKCVNDKFGHQVGDEVLCEVAKRIKAVMRDEDIVGRFGGEEFLVAVDHSVTLEVAARMAERVRQCVADTPIETDAGPIDVTISVGLIYADDAGHLPMEQYVHFADEAMYVSKSEGRNRVTVWTVDGQGVHRGDNTCAA